MNGQESTKRKYQKALDKGVRPLCPYCAAPLDVVRMYRTVMVDWTWNEKKKRYIKSEDDVCADKPFCVECETSSYDFVCSGEASKEAVMLGLDF